MAEKKPRADWEAIKLRFRAGSSSLRQIGAEFGVSEGAIRKRAKVDGWTRDLRKQVQEATDALVVRKASTQQVRTEREAVAIEAEMRSERILAHRQDIQAVREVLLQLLAEARHQTENATLYAELGEAMRREDERGTDKLNDIYRKAMSLPSRTSTVKQIAETLAILIKLEREAYSLNSEESDKGADDIWEKLAKEAA